MTTSMATESRRGTRAHRAGLAGKAVSQLLLLVFAFGAIFPIYFVVASAFKTHDEYLRNIWGLPIQPTLDTFMPGFPAGQPADLVPQQRAS